MELQGLPTMLTPQQRLDAYQYSLDYLAAGTGVYICPRLGHWTKQTFKAVRSEDVYLIIDALDEGLLDKWFPELIAFRPDHRGNDQPWFTDREQRLDALHICIVQVKGLLPEGSDKPATLTIKPEEDGS